MARAVRRAQSEIEAAFNEPDLVDRDLYLTVKGFKAIGSELELRVAPLTLISGVNSAGKSSFLQPLLLMKQTLDSSFDPGAILLHGPNAKFTQDSQVLSRGKSRSSMSSSFSVGLRVGEYARVVAYRRSSDGLEIESDTFAVDGSSVALKPGQSFDNLKLLAPHLTDYGTYIARELAEGSKGRRPKGLREISLQVEVDRNRCFLDLSLSLGPPDSRVLLSPGIIRNFTATWSSVIRGIIHVPGLRGNPEREYSKSAVGSTFPGTIETYAASIILEWERSRDERLSLLAHDLERLGLTWKVQAKKLNDASVEVLVGRLPHPQQGGALDMVSVADVGFGVSQTLPVLVALLVARPGQIVYLEQPEIHLHPRAQLELAHSLVNASLRGVKVVAETHSSLLIRAIQTAVAKKELPPSAVSLNWFSRDEASGFARIDVAEVDEQGRFGDWPLDFDDVLQEADYDYLDAIHGEPR